MTPAWLYGGAAAAILAAGIGIGHFTTQWRADAKYSALVASNAKAMQTYADRSTAAEERERTEEHRRQEEKTRIEDETRAQIEKSSAAAAAAAAELGRLRSAVAAYTARQRSAGASPAAGPVGPGVGSDDAIGVLSGLLDRHTAELTEVGRYADGLRDAGAACEKQYDTLRKP